MNLILNDKIALVTGGSRGIGRECCLGLARSGAKVVINYGHSAKEGEALEEDILKMGFSAFSFCADITDESAVAEMFDFIREKFGRLDILVNNAGIVVDRLLLAMKAAEWDRVVDVNLKGAFFTCQKATELMVPNHRGKIINISSTSAIRGGKGQTNYAAAKGGLVSFTRACAIELAPKSIQVNAVLPGVIMTRMSHRIRKRAAEEILNRIPAGRFGKPSDVAELVVFLASENSDYITGQAISVDGGLSVF